MQKEIYGSGVVFIKAINPDNNEEYSIFKIVLEKDSYKGDENPDIYLYETTGYLENE